MRPIPGFNESELWVMRTTLKERYGEEVPLESVETEVRLSTGAKELTTCPGAYWEARGAHFVVLKTAQRPYHAQFFYRIHQIFGTGIDEFDDLADCTVALLRAQADHEAESTSNT